MAAIRAVNVRMRFDGAAGGMSLKGVCGGRARVIDANQMVCPA
jgi:hypothetical protein